MFWTWSESGIWTLKRTSTSGQNGVWNWTGIWFLNETLIGCNVTGCVTWIGSCFWTGCNVVFLG